MAEEGSIHAGARAALISQPALSTTLRNLEKELGATLFERSHRGVELTPAGSALLVHARQLVQAMDDTKNVVQAGAKRRQRTFTIGLVEGYAAAAELTGPILAAFQRSHPDLRIQIRRLNFVDQVDAVLDGSVDVGLVRSPYEHDDLVLVPLFSEPTILLASCEHPIARLDEAPIELILDEPLLEQVRTPPQWRDFWNLSEWREGRSRTVETDAVDILQFSMDLAINSTVSPMALSAWRLGGLTELLFRGVRAQDGPRNVAGVGHRRHDNRREVQAFARIAVDVCRAMIALVPESDLAEVDRDDLAHLS
ncbi:LysR family transcriptional regulator [Mycobacterium vicinigordonae]|uniref:LysR family transcriptional regulator n=1 Tax=Mycobacterium vicinigordonae TaxID=1719132 RepID=A0A7D6DWS9_9MYCO|nr:LysR family transcriptional regulator [Mycobacterium vicinigordonae]